MSEDTIRSLTDRIAVEDLLTRYATAVDGRDWNLLRTVFTPDARIDDSSAGGVAASVDEAVAFLDTSLADYEMTQHMVTNVAADIDGDRAQVTAMLHNPMRRAGGDVWFCGGWYDHSLVRTDGGWRSERLVFRAAWFDGLPS